MPKSDHEQLQANGEAEAKDLEQAYALLTLLRSTLKRNDGAELTFENATPALQEHFQNHIRLLEEHRLTSLLLKSKL